MLSYRMILTGLCFAAGIGLLAQPPAAPEGNFPLDDPKKPAILLIDDQSDRLIPLLTNDNEANQFTAEAAVEEADVYSGSTALRVTPQQRFRGKMPGWAYPIREKPNAGEFRFLRFAWKKVGGACVMLQLHNGDIGKFWEGNRYFSGTNVTGWGGKQLSPTIPSEWTVVTRDLFEDFGAMTLTGIAFTPADGQYGLFDHVLLGRTVADLNALSDELSGRVKPKVALAGMPRDAAWASLSDRDGQKSGLALRSFLADASGQVTFLRERLTAGEVGKALPEIPKLIAGLGDDDFDTRLRSDAALEKIGAAAHDELLDAAKSTNPEVAYRASRLIARLKLTGTPTGTIRASRIARVLERAGTDEARKLLTDMADGTFGSVNAAVAKATLARMPAK